MSLSRDLALPICPGHQPRCQCHSCVGGGIIDDSAPFFRLVIEADAIIRRQQFAWRNEPRKEADARHPRDVY